MEKRAFTRQILHHPAQISSSGSDNQPCVIEDFCKNGLFVTFDYQESDLLHSSARPIAKGDRVYVEFQAGAGLKLSYRIEAEVARILDSAMGLRISNSSPEAIHTLYQIARNSSSGIKSEPGSAHGEKPPVTAHQSTPEQQRIKEQCAQILKGFLASNTNQLFHHLRDALVLKASQAETNVQERAYFEIMEKLSHYRQRITKAFQQGIIEQLDNWAEGKEISLPGEVSLEGSRGLSLIEKEEFEDWLIVKVTITKADQNYKELIYPLTLRMNEVGRTEIEQHNNPLGPAYITHAFYQAIRPLAFTKEIAKLVFKVFDESLITNLEILYHGLNNTLISSGILPEIKFKAINPDNRAAKSAASKNDAAQKTDEAQDKGGHLHAVEATGKDAKSQQRTPHLQPQNNRPGVNAAGAEGFAAGQASAQQAAAIAQHLLNLQYAAARATKAEVTPEQALQQDSGKALATHEAVSYLSKLQALSVGAGQDSLSLPLSERVKQHLEGEQSQLKEEDRRTLEFTEQLFTSMLDHPSLKEPLKFDIKKLEIPLLKILMQDASFLEREQHPARQVLNKLAQIGVKGGYLNKAIEANVANIINKIVEEFETDTQVFEQSLADLDQLLEKQQQVSKRNTERVIESYEGKQAVENAKNAVRRFCADHIGDRCVPKLLVDLLDFGWRDLLVFTLLRDGNESPIWKSYTKVVETLAQIHPDDDRAALQPQAKGIYKIIETGISESPSGKARMRNLLPAIQDLLQPGEDSAQPTFITINKAEVTPDSAFSVIDDASLQDKALARWIKRARKLNPGDWVELIGKQDYLQVRLAWIGEDCHKFVFVNHQGMNVVEFSLLELAQHMQSRQIRLIAEPNQPFVDQSLDQMVQQIYEQVNHETNHDELTGLINRKEFERQLNQSLQQAKQEQRSHAMLHLDLDQFKLINNSCGHAAGDKLLQEIARLIESYTIESNIVARLGGNEFAILVQDMSGEEAVKYARDLRMQIQEYRFDWEGKRQAVGASIGIAEFDESTAGVDNIIDAAESAKLSAKEAGSNRVYLYQPGDKEIELRNQVMEKISRLNKALDEGRLQLRCQKIAPIQSGSDELPRYEILLSLEDESGLHLSPADFIHAAERYHRMQAVDRWVIHNVFRWMASNKSKLSQIGGCSINLSGHSLNDESLMAYIFEELQATDIPREKICFEITETTAVTNLEDAADFIQAMKELGFKFALDDFGTGFSSYKYLKSLPFDYLKIEGSFVRNIAHDSADYNMVQSIHSMAHMMGVRTVAEFVEDHECLEKLREIGVDYAQGYGIEKPQLLHNICNRAA